MEKIFNMNTGYFVNNIQYNFCDKKFIGYELCQGYIIFGIPGYSRIDACYNKESL